MRLICPLPALLLLIATGLQADDRDVSAYMREASDVMLGLLPRVEDPDADRKQLIADVERLQHLLREAEPHFDDDRVTSVVTFNMLDEQLESARRMLPQGHDFFVRQTLNDAFELCAACHTSDHRSKRAFGISRLGNMSEYLAAEYSYLTRDYASATTSYGNFLAKPTGTQEERDRALNRLLTIHLDVEHSPERAAKAFTRILDSDARTGEQERLGDWIDTLSALDTDDFGLQSPYGKRTAQELATFLKNEWPGIRAATSWNSQQVWWVAIRGELNRLLLAAPTDADTPLVLYWLAVADRSLHYQFYNSLSRHYLEQCVLQFPDHPVAPDCLDEYELLMLVSFSGSGGTQLPIEAQRDIDQLRRVIRKARSAQ